MDIISRKEAKEQGLKSYYTGKPCKRGHLSERRVSDTKCKECCREQLTLWSKKTNYSTSKKYREYQSKWRGENREKVNEYGRQNRKDNWRKYIISRLRFKNKLINLECDLTEEDIGEIPSHCPVLGIPIKGCFYDGTPRTDNSPSIDRIDNSKGYTRDNILIVSWKANRLKNSATKEELKKLLDYVNTHHKTTAHK